MRLQLVATDRPVDLIAERIDLALRVRAALTSDAALTMRTLGLSTRILVAAPRFASEIADVEQLTGVPTLSTSDDADDLEWRLEHEEGRSHSVRVTPRMGCADMMAVRHAAIEGLGVAILPDHVCRDALSDGRLVRVLPAWHGLKGIVHLVFTTRRGLPPAVRALIDHLAAGFQKELATKATA